MAVIMHTTEVLYYVGQLWIFAKLRHYIVWYSYRYLQD